MELPKNEPVLTYKKGSKERTELERAIAKLKSSVNVAPIVIGDKEIFPDDVDQKRDQVIVGRDDYPYLRFFCYLQMGKF